MKFKKNEDQSVDTLPFLRKLDIVVPEDPAIPLLGIYPEDASTCNKDTYS